ncbi:dUTP diphosphatase [Gilvimarinus sp. SDUM040013]|uniref:dUTP diphosphatase n=2 Tax=Gilvimarinus gilvus TaxID=3058038 RepID=A0ABU4RW96_9GAMM|nr:dUTP diphosphatase [Gilvimarinus sp. SDUM040013]MDO3386575.1 dUTP diphosphatase [Gilvimarinus sp. SDUM040013]MDX6849151.1 dUTP diphosphatase [Gilvimarinus sp. SDUM040013]
MSLETVKQQTLTMLQLQDDMNSKVHPEWRVQGNAWYRAIWIECGELMDHYGWKWWKHQTPDTEQVALELVDIWHFGLSILLEGGASPDAIADQVARELVINTDQTDLRLDVEAFTAATLADQQFHLDLFGRLLAGVNMDYAELYRRYVGKNVLNFFRQDNGYKDGTYRKLWFDGREDNEHLVEVVEALDASAQSFSKDVYTALGDRYSRP